MDISLQQGIDTRIRVLRGLDAAGERKVVYWGIGAPVESYKVGNPLAFDAVDTNKAAQVKTRLTRYPEEVQNLVMKAGYAQADAALRASNLILPASGAPSFAALPLVR